MLKKYIIAVLITPLVIVQLVCHAIIYWVRYPAFWSIPSIRNPFAFVDVYFNIGKFLAECLTDVPLLRGGFGFSCDGNHYITVNCAKTAKDILTQTKQFPKNPLSYDIMMAPLLGKGLITSDGERWQMHNLAMKPYFTFPYLNEVLLTFASKAFNFIDSHSNKGPMDNSLFCTQLTLRIIISFVFGRSSDAEQLSKSWQDVLASFAPVALFSKFACKMTPALAPHIFPHFYSKLKFLRDQIEKEMAVSRENESVLSRMVSETSLFSKEDCIDHCMTFMFAGHDTTANTLAWIFYYLHTEEQVFQKLRQEVVQQVQVREEMNFSAEKLHQMKYLRAVIMETLRRSPPILLLERKPESRISKYIKPGAVFAISVYSLHHNSEYWQNPFSFIPERFVEASSLYENIIAGAYLPFSVADRACLGKKMAIYELQIVVLICMLHFTWKLDISEMKPSYSPFYHPSGMKIQFERKSTIPQNSI